MVVTAVLLGFTAVRMARGSDVTTTEPRRPAEPAGPHRGRRRRGRAVGLARRRRRHRDGAGLLRARTDAAQADDRDVIGRASGASRSPARSPTPCSAASTGDSPRCSALAVIPGPASAPWLAIRATDRRLGFAVAAFLGVIARRVRRRRAGVARLARVDGARRVEHGVEHRRRELAGERVLLARVERAQDVRPSGDRHLDAVAEPRLRARTPSGGTRRRRRTGRAATTTRTRSAAPARARGTARTCRARRRRLVGRRRAAHGGGDVRDRAAPARRRRARSWAGWPSPAAVHRREQEVARAVAGEHPTGAVAAVGRGREAEDEDRAPRVAEAGNGSRPVVLVGERRALLAADLLTPRDQARARAAGTISSRSAASASPPAATGYGWRHRTNATVRPPWPVRPPRRDLRPPRPDADDRQGPARARRRPARWPTRAAQQAQAVAERLASHKNIAAVYASPLQRTRETAAPIGKALGQRVQHRQGSARVRLRRVDRRRPREAAQAAGVESGAAQPVGIPLPRRRELHRDGDAHVARPSTATAASIRARS